MSKVVLITGASSGIGRITAEYLTKNGFVVYGTSRNPKPEQFSFSLIALDVTKTESVSSAVAQVIEKEGCIDVLINNAGMGITGPIEETPINEMKHVFDTNFYGAIEMAKAVLPQMRKQQSGLIINITSIAGYMGLPFRGIYSATKSALEMVGEALRMEVKSFGVEVVNMAPGDFATNIAAGRYHTPVNEQSPYRDIYQSNLDTMNTHVDDGGDPIDMAKAIAHVINHSKPKVHYKIGSFLQKFSIVLKRVLPDQWYEKMLMNHYGMK